MSPTVALGIRAEKRGNRRVYDAYFPSYFVTFELLFWMARKLALEAVSEEALYCVQAMIMATTGIVAENRCPLLKVKPALAAAF